MKYFKNTELAKLYHVSEKSVRNWIEATQSEKLDLQLLPSNGKQYIANTNRNIALIEKQVQWGKKFKNMRGYKRINPLPELYKRYNDKQILDIISNVETHHEIPYQYTYFNGGAEHWDLYTQNLLSSPAPNYLTDIVELLEGSIGYLDKLTNGANVNIIDVGVGNGLPVRKFVEHFAQQGRLKRYIGIDISKDMLEITKRNFKDWFDDQFPFEDFVRDINYDRFDDLLVSDSFDSQDNPTINVVLYLGSTIVNFRKPEQALRVINDSMGKRDLFLLSLKLDSEQSRRYFDFTTASPDSAKHFRGKDLIEILGIDESFYDVEQFFDEKAMMRKVRIKLKVALSITFQLKGQHKTIELNKDDTILLWRARHQGAIEVITQLYNNDFELLQAARSKDEEHFLSIFKVKSAVTY